MAPLLPGEITLEVYLPSSAPEYPVAETTANVQAGHTLRTRLVIDTSGVAQIEGTVTQAGAPLAYAPVQAYSPSRDWMAAIEAWTDVNGQYVLSNVRAGKVRVTAWEPGGPNSTMDKVVDIAENEVHAVDFDFETHGGGIEGYVFVNGAPGQAVQVTAELPTANRGNTSSTAFSDHEGYYRITNLAQGTYALRVYMMRPSGGCGPTMEVTVDVGENEMIRQDFVQEGGAVQGNVQGLCEGEVAGVALFKEWTDPATLLTLSMTEMEDLMLTSMEVAPGKPLNFDNVPPGTYYMGVVALPGNRETDEWDIGDSLQEGRFAVQMIEIVPNETTTVQVTIP